MHGYHPSWAVTASPVCLRLHLPAPLNRSPSTARPFSTARLEPLGLDRRYNRYWRLPGAEQQEQQPAAEQQQQQGEEGGEGGAAAEAAPGPATPALPPPVGDRLLIESQEDGSLSVITTKAALAALMAALERKGARESGLYASLIRHRAQLEAGMPAGPLALPAPEGDAAAQQAQQAEQAQRQALLGLPLSAPALQPSKLPGRASKKAKEAAAAEGAVEEAAAADLAPLREGDSLAITRIKTVRWAGVGCAAAWRVARGFAFLQLVWLLWLGWEVPAGRQHCTRDRPPLLSFVFELMLSCTVHVLCQAVPQAVQRYQTSPPLPVPMRCRRTCCACSAACRPPLSRKALMALPGWRLCGKLTPLSYCAACWERWVGWGRPGGCGHT